MNISFAITVCNEIVEIQNLITNILKYKHDNDEIIVLFDSVNGSTSVEEYLRSHSINGEFNWYYEEFTGNFADWKNKLNSYCDNQYICQLDADEQFDEYFINYLHQTIESNPAVELYYFPRLNLVEGLTQEHINKWHWHVDEYGRVNWPDRQGRLYKNLERIKWEGKVHEKITGHKTVANMPDTIHLMHYKTISRQELQNELYARL